MPSKKMRIWSKGKKAKKVVKKCGAAKKRAKC